jgi:hypothetical protein
METSWKPKLHPASDFVHALSHVFYAGDRLFRMEVAHTKFGPLMRKSLGFGPDLL